MYEMKLIVIICILYSLCTVDRVLCIPAAQETHEIVSDFAPVDNIGLNIIRNNFDAVVVMFYAPWCGHSRAFLPSFDSLISGASSSSSNGGSFTFSKVDCVAEPSLYWKYDIESFPTFKIFVGGEDGVVINYHGEHNPVEIEEVVRGLSTSVVLPFPSQLHKESETNMDGLSSLPSDSRVVSNEKTHVSLTVSLPKAKEVTTIRRFDAACKKMNRFPCYVQTIPYIEGSETSEIVTLTAYEYIENTEISKQFTSKTSGQAMVDWMVKYTYPKVIEFKQEYSEEYIFSEYRPGYKNHIILLLTNYYDNYSQQILNNAKATAGALLGEAIFMFIDINNLTTYQENIMEGLKVDSHEAPIAILVSSKKTSIEFFVNSDGDLINEQLLAWATAVLAGKVKYTHNIEMESEDED
jgi:thiol-disulfide isomerase/thioredoxin